MEKQMSVEERIRRAEARYNEKKDRNYEYTDKDNASIYYNNEKMQSETPKIEIKKSKLFMQIFICLMIYLCFYTIKNSEYIFSENFKNDINIFFTEKTKIYKVYSDLKSYISENFFNEKENQVQDNNQTEVVDENKNEENSNNEEIESVGGAEDTSNEEKEELDENAQMQKDVEEIKSKVSFIVPVEGRISSKFGWRNPTVSTVPKYHTGLDIAAVSGTKIKSATEGVVKLVSSEGDYGNHYFIETNNITIIYAHCQKLYLKEGDTVTQGQEIAEVGSTGNSTGPHLHFEIRIDGRKVDPQLILDI